MRSLTLAFSATSRSMACGVTTGEVMCRLSMPASPSASASPSLAQHTPSAPEAIWRRAMSADLWVLECGLRLTLCAFAKDAISAMLRSSLSRSSTSAGVFSERREPCWPIRWR